MVCQSCLQSAAKVDEVDMQLKFNGHKVCQVEVELKELQEFNSNTQGDEQTIEELEGRIETLEDEARECEETREIEQEYFSSRARYYKRLDKEFID